MRRRNEIDFPGFGTHRNRRPRGRRHRQHRRADLGETDKRHLEYVVSEVSRINTLITVQRWL